MGWGSLGTWGIRVTGEFLEGATILVSASCNRLLMLSVSLSVDDLLCVDSLLESESWSDPAVIKLSAFLISSGIQGWVSSASEVLGLWKCTFWLLRYFHSEYRVSHLICLLL